MKKFFVYVLLLSIGLLNLCTEKKVKVVAKVNGIEIYEDEVNLRIKESGASPQSLQKESSFYRIIFAEKLKESIENALILSSYPEIVKEFREEDLERELFKSYNEEEVRKFLEEKGIDFSLWKNVHKRDILATFILNRVLNPPSESDEGKEKESEKAREIEAETPYVKFQQIVTKDEDSAEEVMNRLKRGEDFQKLAEEFSIAPEKGKILGPFFPGELPSEFDICFNMREGEISNIVKSPYGFHIFKLVEKGVGEKTFLPRQVERKIEIERRTNEAYSEFIKNLKKKAKIEIYVEQLK